MMNCNECKSDKWTREYNQTFKDGTIHIRVECDRCGVFVGYKDKLSGDSFFIATVLNWLNEKERSPQEIANKMLSCVKDTYNLTNKENAYSLLNKFLPDNPDSKVRES